MTLTRRGGLRCVAVGRLPLPLRNAARAGVGYRSQGGRDPPPNIPRDCSVAPVERLAGASDELWRPERRQSRPSRAEPRMYRQAASGEPETRFAPSSVTRPREVATSPLRRASG